MREKKYLKYGYVQMKPLYELRIVQCTTGFESWDTLKLQLCYPTQILYGISVHVLKIIKIPLLLSLFYFWGILVKDKESIMWWAGAWFGFWRLDRIRCPRSRLGQGVSELFLGYPKYSALKTLSKNSSKNKVKNPSKHAREYIILRNY